MTIAFSIVIRDRKIRKAFAPKVRVVPDKTKYSRKVKHRALAAN